MSPSFSTSSDYDPETRNTSNPSSSSNETCPGHKADWWVLSSEVMLILGGGVTWLYSPYILKADCGLIITTSRRVWKDISQGKQTVLALKFILPYQETIMSSIFALKNHVPLEINDALQETRGRSEGLLPLIPCFIRLWVKASLLSKYH